MFYDFGLNDVINHPHSIIKLLLTNIFFKVLLILDVTICPKPKHIMSWMYDHSLLTGFLIILNQLVLEDSREELISQSLLFFCFYLFLFLAKGL